ncbi:MAG TPA: hypothetical protein VHA52_04560 [Candidatus Babeliaceae bacterium]|jgi:hypothetical protein|nr:hypothetical protein [Candidatus Babeliaceae bacterium]
MEQFTKEQLVAAQIKYNKEFAESPTNFKLLSYIQENPEQCAIEQIDYLISLIDA